MKNHDLYIKKLLQFANALGITVSWKNTDLHEGWYDQESHSITLSNELDEEEEIAILLHELGHAVDEYRSERLNQKSVSRAYTAVYEKRASDLQTQKVVADEKAAWKIGRIIAKQLKIRLGKWYTENEKECMWVYRNWKKN